LKAIAFCKKLIESNVVHQQAEGKPPTCYHHA
jgi:hypothetical protein